MLAMRFRLDVSDASGELMDNRVLPAMWSGFGGYMAWFAGCLIFFTRSYGLYGPIQNRSGLNEQRMTLQATLVAGLILCGTIYLSRGEQLSRIAIILSVLLTGAMLCARRALWRSMVYTRFREGMDTRNVLIVGAGRVAHALRNHLESMRHLGFRFRGFVSLTEPEAESGDADIIGDVSNCLALARALFIDEIFFSVPADKKMVINAGAGSARDGYRRTRCARSVRRSGLERAGGVCRPVSDHPAASPRFSGGRFHDEARPRPHPVVPRASSAQPVAGGRWRSRSAWTPRDPVFYKARRVGRKGRNFDCMKFRTMVVNADEMKAKLAHLNERDGILFKMSNDPRITRVGRFLRKYSLDEVPQFLNVLRGDMSMVGPRPPIASEVERYDLSHLRRLDVLPGITGLWQVEARQDPSFDSYISLDTAYVDNWNLWLDLKILVRTVSVVIGGTGA